jgi:hypothetical protein
MYDVDLPMIPNASKLELGREISGSWSLGITEIAASPYLTLTGGDARWPLDARGWIMRPSTAAQMRSLRASEAGMVGLSWICMGWDTIKKWTC